MEDKKILYGHLMSQHRKLTNEIADIKADGFELTEEQKNKIKELEFQVKKIAEQLYVLYQ